MKTLKLKDIEKEYKDAVKKLSDSGEVLNTDKHIELAVQLFNDLKAIGINSDEDKEADMLLFQYGVYNWGGEKGEHFSFDITRQFIKPNDDEPYQLRFTLIFDPEDFRDSDKYNCWSADFDSLDKWIEHIKSTKGYGLAKDKTIRLCEINYSQV